MKTIVNPLIKDQVTFTQTAAETCGRVTTLAVKLMPGGGTPMHYHRQFTETFVVLEGVLTIVLKKRTLRLFPGQEYTVEKRQVHRFCNQSDQPVSFSTIIRPASAGFENSLCILYGMAGDKRTNSKGIPKSLLHLAAISRMSDMHLSGPAVLLSPLLSVLAVIARIMKVEKKLVEQYCSAS